MRGLKSRDLPCLVPKLYGVAVNKLAGPLFGVVVALAGQLYAVLNVTVPPDDVSAIPEYGGSLLWRLKSGGVDPFVQMRSGVSLTDFLK